MLHSPARGLFGTAWPGPFVFLCYTNFANEIGEVETIRRKIIVNDVFLFGSWHYSKWYLYSLMLKWWCTRWWLFGKQNKSNSIVSPQFTSRWMIDKIGSRKTHNHHQPQRRVRRTNKRWFYSSWCSFISSKLRTCIWNQHDVSKSTRNIYIDICLQCD